MNIYLASLMYLVPSYLYIYMATIIIKNNSKSQKYIVSSVLFVVIAIWFFIAFVIAIAPAHEKIFILTYLVQPILLVSIMLTLHLWLLITGAYQKKHATLYKLLFFPSFLLVILLFIDNSMFQNFANYSNQIYFQPRYGLYLFWVTITIYLLVITGLLIAYMKHDRKLAKLWLTGITLSFIWTTVMNFGWFYIEGGQLGFFIRLIPHGTIFWAVAIYISISKYHFLPAYQKRYKVLFDKAPLGILILNRDGIIREVSPVVIHYFDLPKSDLIDMNFFTFLDNKKALLKQYKLSFRQKTTMKNIEFTYRKSEKGEKTFSIDSEFIEMDDETLQFLMIRDITEQKQQQLQINYLAYHDPLTGIYNRTSFDKEFGIQLQQREPFALILVDINKFKQINDTYGHLTGDKAIKHIANLLKSIVYQDGIVARYGGDEFVILLHRHTRAGSIKKLVEEKLNEPIYCDDGRKIVLSVSIGVSIYPEDGIDVDELFRTADKRMYETKAKVEETSIKS